MSRNKLVLSGPSGGVCAVDKEECDAFRGRKKATNKDTWCSPCRTVTDMFSSSPLLRCHCQPLSASLSPSPSISLMICGWRSLFLSTLTLPGFDAAQEARFASLRRRSRSLFWTRVSVGHQWVRPSGGRKRRKRVGPSAGEPPVKACRHVPVHEMRRGTHNSKARGNARWQARAQHLFWGFHRPWRMRAASLESVRIAKKPTRRGYEKTAAEVNGGDWGQVWSQPLPSAIIRHSDPVLLPWWWGGGGRWWKAAITAETMYHLCY